MWRVVLFWEITIVLQVEGVEVCVCVWGGGGGGGRAKKVCFLKQVNFCQFRTSPNSADAER